ncbi:hypothetical protein XA68_13405 [Ophiocordyceps unilateralis]|uniref:N(6)-L-threonylcarbamoyladenine synthase n=1 Tax=Ophiocordyceps unilateralis TaxID=268505 RepID=A0A2A9PB74_OPHUN|nr:hypothetical protein XA68_13405 [Ophiocordyceps unilateralis]
MLRSGARRIRRWDVDGGRRSLLTLAVETSCDDTAVALLSRSDDTDTAPKLLFNERQCSDNRAFRGVHPKVAIQGHHATLAPLVRRALLALPATRSRPDLVAATRGPGLAANLAVGLDVAKGLALAWRVPLLGVHHMQAHALTPRLARALLAGTEAETTTTTTTTTTSASESPAFPFLSLLVSGGHTQLVLSTSLTSHHLIANTVDIAIGNLLDQAARVVLPTDLLDSCPDVMYGRLLEAFAFAPQAGDDDDMAHQHAAFFRPALSRRHEQTAYPSEQPYGWTVGLPFRESRRLAFSFCGIFSQHLASRLCLALVDSEKLSSLVDVANPSPSLPLPGSERRTTVTTLVLAGGVAANRFLLHVLRSTLTARGLPALDIVVPPIHLCTDNAAMIAWAADEMYRAGWETELSALPVPRWPLDPEAGEGIMGVDGWLRRGST